MSMRGSWPAVACFVCGTWLLCAQLNTAEAVLEKYQQSLGGADAIHNVVSETRRGEVQATGLNGKATFVFYAKPLKVLRRITLPDGREITSGFDGKVSWSITPQGASIDKDTPLESDRHDADLEYALHQPDYFQSLEFAGTSEFDGRNCYWLHGTTVGARTTISSTTSGPGCWPVTAFSRTSNPPGASQPSCFRITKASAGR